MERCGGVSRNGRLDMRASSSRRIPARRMAPIHWRCSGNGPMYSRTSSLPGGMRAADQREVERNRDVADVANRHRCGSVDARGQAAAERAYGVQPPVSQTRPNSPRACELEPLRRAVWCRRRSMRAATCPAAVGRHHMEEWNYWRRGPSKAVNLGLASSRLRAPYAHGPASSVVRERGGRPASSGPFRLPRRSLAAKQGTGTPGSLRRARYRPP